MNICGQILGKWINGFLKQEKQSFLLLYFLSRVSRIDSLMNIFAVLVYDF